MWPCSLAGNKYMMWTEFSSFINSYLLDIDKICLLNTVIFGFYVCSSISAKPWSSKLVTYHCYDHKLNHIKFKHIDVNYMKKYLPLYNWEICHISKHLIRVHVGLSKAKTIGFLSLLCLFSLLQKGKIISEYIYGPTGKRININIPIYFVLLL